MGHVGFLMPLHKQHVFEMLELCRHFNPFFKPRPMREFLKTEEQIFEYEKVIKEVKENIKMMTGPDADE